MPRIRKTPCARSLRNEDVSLSKSDLFFALWYKLTQSGVNVERVDDHSYVIQVNLYDEPVTTMLVDRRVGSTYDMMNAVVTLTFWDYGKILLDDRYIEEAISEDVTNLREAVDWVESNLPSEITNLTYHLNSERDTTELARDIQGMVLQMETDFSKIEEYLQQVYTKVDAASRQRRSTRRKRSCSEKHRIARMREAGLPRSSR